ncbi:transposase [Streptomyces violascens]|uniref:transposase n=1 Tax=Streptomyces violascens TaxID=67381 RepID=UPI003679AFFB
MAPVVGPEAGRTGDRWEELPAAQAELHRPSPPCRQRRWGDAYLRGLLTAPGKKTGSQMAKEARLPPGAAQALQQFISASPRDWCAAREALARKAAARLPGCPVTA